MRSLCYVCCIQGVGDAHGSRVGKRAECAHSGGRIDEYRHMPECSTALGSPVHISLL